MRARAAICVVLASALALPSAATAAKASARAPAVVARAASSSSGVVAVTAQAQAADAAFLAYAPAPAGGADALCLVDTGVSSNPDTAPGLVSATALEEGGSGSDVDPQGHGTTMAMIAGAAGHGMVGAWPQIKIVSVRATTAPPPGQEPTFEFEDYAEGIEHCLQQQASFHIDAIDLALSSTIPPSTNQAQALQSEIAQADAMNVAIVAAAGDAPGPIQEPASEPGILAVGGFTAQPDRTSATAIGAACSFSADEGLTFYAPGCGLDQAEPFTDTPSCCGNGDSQASAFTGAALVALMSYDPGLSYSAAEQLLVSTASDGDLNVAAAFETAGLSSIVTAGNDSIPSASPSGTHHASAKKLRRVKLRALRWRHGVLTIKLAKLPHGDRLRVRLRFAHRVRRVQTRRRELHVHTARPRLVELRIVRGKAKGPILKAKVKR